MPKWPSERPGTRSVRHEELNVGSDELRHARSARRGGRSEGPLNGTVE
jgi:hypothetical protein